MSKAARRGQGEPGRSGGAASILAEPGGAPRATSPLGGRALLVVLVVIVLAMSPATRNLDNIKMALYLGLGPLLLAGVAAEGALGRLAALRPTVFVLWGIYLAVSAVSMFASDYRWAGTPELFFLWASLGFSAAGAAMASEASGLRVMLIVMSGLLLVVNLFGFAQFDLFGTGTTGVTLLQDLIWRPGAVPSADSPGFQTLLYTFSTSASGSLMSTILNRDFYAAFCLLFMGFPLALGLLSERRGLKAFGFATVGLSLLSIVLCQSKGEYVALAALGVLLPALLALGGMRPWPRGGTWTAWLAGSLMLVGAFVLVKSPEIGDQLKSLDHSLRSRLIIHRGAFDIFLEFPWLGGGPGTFKIYFPEFRSPDYFDWGISNVTNFAHNFFLDALSETGAAGFAAVCLLLGAAAWEAVRTIRRRRDDLTVIVSACLLSCVTAFLISNLTSVSARWPIGAVGLWTVVGMLSGMGGRGYPAAPGAAAARRGFVALLIPAALALPLCLNQAWTYWRSQTVFAEGYLLAEQYRDFAIQRIYDGEAMSGEEQAHLTERLNAAARSLRRSTEIDPTLISAYYHLGSTESLLAGLEPSRSDEHLEQALEAFDALAALAPDYAELPYNLGIVHYQFAVRYQRLLEERPPQDASARAALQQLVEQHEMAAVSHFERMGELSQRPEVLLNLGESYSRIGRHDRARDIYLRGMNLNPGELRFAERLLRTSTLLGDESSIVVAQLAMWRRQPLLLDLVLGEDGALARLVGRGDREDFDAAAAEVEARMPADPRLYRLRAMAAERWGSAEARESEIARYLNLGGDASAIALQASAPVTPREGASDAVTTGADR